MMPSKQDALPAVEQLLVEAVKRASRQPQGRVVIVLHLSRMAPPAPRPHHRRIARSILQDTAQRSEGQVFAPRNGDLVLLCRGGAPREPQPPASRHALPSVADPAAIPSVLARLLRVDAPDPSRLISVWPLETMLDAARAYAQDRFDESHAVVPMAEEPKSSPGIVDAIGSLVTSGRIADLMQRQTAAALVFPARPRSPPRAERRRPPAAGRLPAEFDDRDGAPAAPPGRLDWPRPASVTSERDATAADDARGSDETSPDGADAALLPALRPIYRELTFSIAAIEARLRAGGQASSDPFLFRHLAGRLDQRMLELLRDELGGGGTLDLAAERAGGGSGSPLHLNLTIAGVASPSFARLADAYRQCRAQLAVEISFIEACADPGGFATAREILRAEGMTLVLDGVSHLTLLLARPTALRPDVMKLEWSPRLTELRDADARHVRASIEAFGASRVILHRAETEAALRWGVAHGIRKFQGRHVDAMLGAARIISCPLAAGCTLRQCIERASATGRAGRAGCGNPALLDSGVPPAPASGHIPRGVPGAGVGQRRIGTVPA